MMSAVNKVIDFLENRRSEESFAALFTTATIVITKLPLNDNRVPRERRVPRRKDSGSQATEHHSSVQDHFCKEYFKVIDMVLQQLRDQFHQPGIIKYMTIIIIIIMLAYFYCAAYTQVNVNESSTLCDRRSHSQCTVRGIDGGYAL